MRARGSLRLCVLLVFRLQGRHLESAVRVVDHASDPPISSSHTDVGGELRDDGGVRTADCVRIQERACAVHHRHPARRAGIRARTWTALLCPCKVRARGEGETTRGACNC